MAASTRDFILKLAGFKGPMDIMPPKSLGPKGIQHVLKDLSKRKKLFKDPFPYPSEVLDRVAGRIADSRFLRKNSELNTKVAKKMDLRDIEENLGVYVRGKKEQEQANKGIEDAYASSFSLRHPYLTGIPTLGIAPAMAKDNALEKIRHMLLRNHPDLHKHVMEADELRHKREIELMPERIEEGKRQSHERMMGIGALTALSALQSIQDRQREREQQGYGYEKEAHVLNKQALIGPSTELSFLGLPSAIGYLVGKHNEKNKTLTSHRLSEDEAAFKLNLLKRIAEDKPSDLGRIAKFFLIPGYTGYRFGKGSGRQEALEQLAQKTQENELNKEAARGDLIKKLLGGGTRHGHWKAVAEKDFNGLRTVGSPSHGDLKDIMSFERNYLAAEAREARKNMRKKGELNNSELATTKHWANILGGYEEEFAKAYGIPVEELRSKSMAIQKNIRPQAIQGVMFAQKLLKQLEESGIAPENSLQQYNLVGNLVAESEKQARCWEGFEPVPGKKPYTDGSCRPKTETTKRVNKKADDVSLEELKSGIKKLSELKKKGTSQVTIYFASPSQQLTMIPRDAMVSTNEDLAFQMGRFYPKTKERWSEGDISGKWNGATPPTWKAGRIPTGRPKLYRATVSTADLANVTNMVRDIKKLKRSVTAVAVRNSDEEN